MTRTAPQPVTEELACPAPQMFSLPLTRAVSASINQLQKELGSNVLRRGERTIQRFQICREAQTTHHKHHFFKI